MESARDCLRFLLTDTDTFRGKLVDVTLIALNFVFVAIYVLNTYELPPVWLEFFWNLEVGITFIFVLEYLSRLYISDSPIQKVFDPLMVVDLVAIAPVLLILVYPGSAVFGYQTGFLRLFRVFRVFRFLRMTSSRDFFFGQLSESDLQILKLVTIIFSVFFVSAGFFYEVEHAVNPEVDTFRDSLYYTVVTLTTVGFGDIIPHTKAGRWVTIVSIVAGIVLIPWQAGRIVKAWRHQDKVSVECPECGLKYHDPDASHCKACGHVIEQEYDSRESNYL